MAVIDSLILCSIAGLSTLLGCLFIFIRIDNDKINKFISFVLSFSVAIMIGISIVDLIPTSFFSLIHNMSVSHTIILSLLSFFLGIIIIHYLNRIILTDENSLYKIGILSLIALILHNIPEGIATFFGSMKDPTLGVKLTIAIILHNIPEGISISVPIYYSTKSKKKAFFYTLLSAISEPVGGLLAYLLLSRFITDSILSIILLLVSGMMISLSINEMFPKALSYNQNRYIIIGLVLGIIIISINHFVLS